MTAKRYFTLFLLALLSAVGCLAKNAVAPMTAGNVFVKLGDADAANYVEGYSKVKGVVYNHVAIESKGMQRGMENSLTDEYNANEVKRHTTTFDNISRYSVITDRSQIEIVAVLFNTQTGRIENAACCHVGKGGSGPSGIEQPAELAKPKRAGIYDMQGCKVTGKLLPGMYIVDGKKMMVK